ncbi:hypothetical protein [Deefgea rivuli]|uniref:hypothetical protein n=1 Tax=Deefgea rivuli TaxID=400948 RepID=UPI000487A360|nr:hypothetical protein [Deefgea rivuli]
MIFKYEWLSRLINNSKGIWGVEIPLGSSHVSREVLEASNQHDEVEIVCIQDIGGEYKFMKDGGELIDLDLHSIVEKSIVAAAEFQRQCVRIVIDEFHLASFSIKASLIKTAREIQEKTTKIPVQFVFCGNWSYFLFVDEYRKSNGLTSSPAAEYKNVILAPNMNSSDVIKILIDEKLLARPSDIDMIACSFLIEQTAGDGYLIEKAIEYLKEKSGNWIDNLESVLQELSVAPDVIIEIKSRFNSLNEDSKIDLNKILRFYKLVRNFDSIDVECLWLSGLVVVQNIESSKKLIQIASPLISTVLRNNSENIGLKNIAPADAICFERDAITSAAYRKVAQIENLLRNIVVSEWFFEFGEEWQKKINVAKVPAFVGESEHKLIEFTLQCVKEELRKMGLVNSGTPEEESSVTLSKRPRSNVEPLLDSVLNWKKRQEEHHGVELLQCNIMHFLTTENLEKLLLNKTHPFCGDDKPFNKPFLTTALDEYRAIRSAVAHNQPIGLSALSRLDKLQKDFANWLTVFSAGVNQNSDQ